MSPGSENAPNSVDLQELRDIFQTLRNHNVAQGLAVHTRFDDLISRPQVCQNHKLQLQIVFRFLSTVVQWCMICAHIKKIKLSMLCVTGVI